MVQLPGAFQARQCACWVTFCAAAIRSRLSDCRATQEAGNGTILPPFVSVRRCCPIRRPSVERASMNDFDELVFQRLCHLKNARKTVVQQKEFMDLGISLDELVHSLKRMQVMRFCYVLPYPQFATRDFQSFAVEIYADTIDEFLGGG